MTKAKNTKDAANAKSYSESETTNSKAKSEAKADVKAEAKEKADLESWTKPAPTSPSREPSRESAPSPAPADLPKPGLCCIATAKLRVTVKVMSKRGNHTEEYKPVYCALCGGKL